jgi:Protein of unknown function (DUF3558)
VVRKAVLGAAVLCAGMVSACSGEKTSGDPTTAPSAAKSSSTSSGSPGDNDNGAPPISQPWLDVSKFKGQETVCNVVSDVQLQSVGINPKPGKGRSVPGGVECDRHPIQTLGIDLGVEVLTENSGPEVIYGNKDGFAFFAPAQVGIYPAAHVNDTGPPNTGSCRTIVGVAKGVALVADIAIYNHASPSYAQPCPVSDKVAEIMIDNVKGSK